jgi:hypothetical protein
MFSAPLRLMLVLIFCKDMHSGMRSNIEAQIKAKMGDVLLKQE